MGALATGTATRSSSTAGLWAIMPSSDDEEEAISKMPAKMVKDPKLAAEANNLEPKRERESHIYIYIQRYTSQVLLDTDKTKDDAAKTQKKKKAIKTKSDQRR